MKKFLIVLLCILIVAGIGGYCGYRYYHNTYLVMDGETIRRDITELDLREDDLAELEKVAELQNLQVLDLRGTALTIEQYDWLREELPDCEIRWMIPFQGKRYHQTDSELIISAITTEELEQLAYFENLKAIDATAMTDLTMAVALENAYPDVAVSYFIPVGDQLLTKDTAELTVENADVAELTEKLQYLPNMADITFTGSVPANEEIENLKQTYPNITCHWSFTFFGQEVTSDTEEIDLSGIQMDSVEELEAGLTYFNNLRKVTMCDTGLPSEEIDALWKRHPETRFIWNVKIGKFWIRTDATTLMPFQYGYNGTKGIRLYDKDCTELKYLVDMVCMDFGHMGIQDVSFLAYMPNLEYLIIADAPVTDISAMANLKKLKYLEAFLCHIFDISPLLGCTALEDVNLSNNPIQDITVLGQIESLNNIWISGREWPYEQKQILNAAKPDAKIVYYQDVGSTSKGWRSLDNYFNQRDLLGMWYMSDEGDVVYERPKK